jgi:hypothetical protein
LNAPQSTLEARRSTDVRYQPKAIIQTGLRAGF